MKISLLELLEKNSVKSKEDLLDLTLSFPNIPRSHTLPVRNKISVAEHIINCMFILDYLNNSCITPKLSLDEVSLLKRYIQYHEMEELVVGDIPYYVARELGNFSNEIREELTTLTTGSYLPALGGDLKVIFSIVDMLEFALQMSREMSQYKSTESFDYRRLHQARLNAVSEIIRLVSELQSHNLLYISLLAR